jgi:hypothetical protein
VTGNPSSDEILIFEELVKTFVPALEATRWETKPVIIKTVKNILELATQNKDIDAQVLWPLRCLCMSFEYLDVANMELFHGEPEYLAGLSFADLKNRAEGLMKAARIETIETADDLQKKYLPMERQLQLLIKKTKGCKPTSEISKADIDHVKNTLSRVMDIFGTNPHILNKKFSGNAKGLLPPLVFEDASYA